MSALHDLAARAGLARQWHDVFGTVHDVAPDTLRSLLGGFGFEAHSEAACRDASAMLDAEVSDAPALLTATEGEPLTIRHAAGSARLVQEDGTASDIRPHDIGDGRLGLPALAAGYHRLQIGDAVIDLAIAPARAFTVRDALARRDRTGKAWALAVQVYGLAREGDGGVGDFEALGQFARNAARHGADAVAISPVHALYASEPGHYGPYGPSSRIALNPVYAGVAAGEASPEASGGLIDWRDAAPRRYAALHAAFASDRDDPQFRAFSAAPPPAIALHALFEALVAYQIAAGAGRDWRRWVPDLRDPASPAVRRLAASLQAESEFHLYAQWRALVSLRQAQRDATDAGMAVGLIADLAVGADPAGSDAWSRPTEVLRGASVGAPPDEFNRRGQNWGLTAFSPRGLRQSGFSALRDMLSAALEPAGGVRIDHAMGLSRLWVIPEGGEAKDGSYLSYPFDDMRRIAMLESVRHRGIVVAEDLGTVPEGFRESLAASGIAGMSILWFERQGDRFTPPALWRADTAALTTTHDLPTTAGWWRGTDIGWRERLGIAGEDEAKRAHDRPCLWDACLESGAAQGAMPAPDDGDAIADVVARHVATAASDLLILPVEDALALDEQPNIPGTIDEHPNWRRRLPGHAATLLDAPRVAARLSGLDRKRKEHV